MLKFKRSATSVVSAKPALVYEIVSDYAGYQQWMPGLASTHLLAQESNFGIAEFEFEANPGPKLTLECIHAPTSMVVLRSLSGNKPIIKMEWSIKPDPSGAQVTLKVEGPITPSFAIGHKGIFRTGKSSERTHRSCRSFGRGSWRRKSHRDYRNRRGSLLFVPGNQISDGGEFLTWSRLPYKSVTPAP